MEQQIKYNDKEQFDRLHDFSVIIAHVQTSPQDCTIRNKLYPSLTM